MGMLLRQVMDFVVVVLEDEAFPEVFLEVA